MGDVYALIVEYWYSQGNMEQAYQHIERMRAQRIQLGPYLDKNMVDAVYTAMGIEETREAGDDDGTARASGVRAWNGDDGGPYFKNTVRKLRYDADVLGFDMAAFGALVEDEAASIWSLGRPSVAVGKPPARRRAGN